MIYDNVGDFELVLSKGTISQVTRLSRPDRFLALRGGGTYHGIITKVTPRAFEAKSV